MHKDSQNNFGIWKNISSIKTYDVLNIEAKSVIGRAQNALLEYSIASRRVLNLLEIQKREAKENGLYTVQEATEFNISEQFWKGMPRAEAERILGSTSEFCQEFFRRFGAFMERDENGRLKIVDIGK